MSKKSNSDIVKTVKKVQGLNRSSIKRPRSVTFDDRTKFNRAREKQKFIHDNMEK